MKKPENQKSAWCRRGGRPRLALMLALSMTVSTTNVAIGTGAQAAPSRGDAVANAVSKASDVVDVEASPTAPFNNASGAVSTAAGQRISVGGANKAAVVDLTAGRVPLRVTLPTTQKPTAMQVATNGTAVLPDGNGKLDIAVQAFDTGAVRINTVLNGPDASTVQKYELALPAGARLQPLPDQGGYLIVVKDGTLGPSEDDGSADSFDYGTVSGGTGTVTPKPKPPIDDNGPAPVSAGRSAAADDDENGPPYDEGEAEALAASVGLSADEVPVFRIDSPWAVDANGATVPTSYSVQGNTLTQVVDTRNAAFPVVADPAFIPIIIFLTAAAARTAAPAVARALAAQTIRATARATVQGGYRTFDAFKRAHVTGKERTHQWHHIVEQGNIKRHNWDARKIHNKNNMIQIPKNVHQKCINSNMASKNVNLPGWTSGPYNTLRDSIKNLGWEKQYQIGVILLKYCGVRI